MGLGALAFNLGGYEETLERVTAYREGIKNAKPVGAFVNNQMATLCLVHVGEDDREAKEIGGREGQWFVNKTNDIYRPWYEQGTNVPESYRFSVSQRGQTDRQQATMEDHLRSGRFAMGDPDSVIKVMKRYADAGVDQVLCFMQLGNLPHSRVMDSINQWC